MSAKKLPQQAGRWPPPAWSCYASDDMASEAYKLATLAEIGLLTAMRNYAWVNGTVPSDKRMVARLLSLDPLEVERSWGALVDSNFRVHPQDENRLYSPDLERQRQRMAEIRAKQSRAGSATARARREAKAAKEKTGERSPPRTPHSSPHSSAVAPELNRRELKEGLQDGVVVVGEVERGPHDDFIRALD